MKGFHEFRRGWKPVLTVMVAIGFGQGGVIQYGYGVFIVPLTQAFHASLTQIGAWSSFVSIGGLFSAPVIGRLADRYGVRPVVLAIVPAMAVVLAAVGAGPTSVMLLWVAALFVGVTGIATGALTYARVVNGWFVTRRGAALGIMSAGVGIGAVIGPRLAQGVVDSWGWRAGFFAMALCALVPVPLMALWLFEPKNKVSRSDLPPPEYGYNLGEALRHRCFWLMGPAAFLWLTCFGGVFFLIPFLGSLGHSRERAAAEAGLFGITSFIGRVSTGAIMDYLPAAFVCSFLFFLEAVAFALLGFFGGRFAVLAILTIGFAHGTENVGFAYCIARYFGMKSFSAISGFFSFFTAIGLAIAPIIFSTLREHTGNYRLSYLTSAALACGAALLYILVGFQKPAPLGPIPS